MSVIPFEVPLIILNPFAFVLYGNGENVVVLLLKLVLVEQVAILLCICKVQSLRLDTSNPNGHCHYFSSNTWPG